jgi:hypothetical protein
MRSAAEDIDGACGRAACRRHSSARARRGRRKEREPRGIGSPNEHAPAESLPSLCCLFATSITSCDWHVSTRARFMAALAASMARPDRFRMSRARVNWAATRASGFPEDSSTSARAWSTGTRSRSVILASVILASTSLSVDSASSNLFMAWCSAARCSNALCCCEGEEPSAAASLHASIAAARLAS